MSDEWIAGLITVVVIAALVAWVPCLIGMDRCLRRLEKVSDRQAARYSWRTVASNETETGKVVRRG